MLVVPITDFKEDVESWLTKAKDTDIIIEKDGKPFANIKTMTETKPNQTTEFIADKLFGVLKGFDVDFDQIRQERLLEK